MKVRDGFVSNSSSTCWVLDIRQDGVKELVDKELNGMLKTGLRLYLTMVMTIGV